MSGATFKRFIECSRLQNKIIKTESVWFMLVHVFRFYSLKMVMQDKKSQKGAYLQRQKSQKGVYLQRQKSQKGEYLQRQKPQKGVL